MMTPNVALSRRERYALLVACVLLVIFAAAVELLRPNPRTGLRIEATGSIDAYQVASLAHDGRDESAWIGPSGASADLVVRFDEPRVLRAVRVANARHDKHHLGTRELEIELSGAGGTIGRERVELPLEGPPLMVPMAAEGVTTARFRIVRWYGIAGGLGEVTFLGP